MIKPNFDDAPGELEKKKQQAAAAESNWKQFLNSYVGKFVTGYGKDMAQGFTGPGSPGSFIAKGFRAGTGVLQRNPAASETLAKVGGAVLTPTILAAKNAQQLIEFESKQMTNFKIMQRESDQELYDNLKKNNPTSPLIEELEKELAKPFPEAIESPEDTATALTNFYDSYHQGAAAYLLSKNPDIERKALETNQSVWDTATAYSKEVSFGQSVFDNFASFVDRDSMFDIDITDPEQRDYLFYSGDGLVGGIGKGTSGGIDLGMQIFGDPFWVAGKGVKAARLGLINVKTVAEAEKGVRGLWQQSYFVEGQKGIDDYAKSQGNYGKLTDEKNELEKEKLRLETLRASTDDLIKNPSVEAPLKDSLKTKELIDEEIANISQQIDNKILEVRASTPKVSKGHDEFHEQVISGKLTASDLAEHPRFTRYGAMKTKLAEA